MAAGKWTGCGFFSGFKVGVGDKVEGENVLGKLLLGFLHFEFVDEGQKGSDLFELLFGGFGRGSFGFSFFFLLQWLKRVECELGLVFEVGGFNKGQQGQLLFGIGQELLGQNLDQVAGIIEIDSTHGISFSQTFSPVTVRTKSLINISRGVNKLNTQILFTHLTLDKSLNGKSLAFKQSFDQGSELLAFD